MGLLCFNVKRSILHLSPTDLWIWKTNTLKRTFWKYSYGLLQKICKMPRVLQVVFLCICSHPASTMMFITASRFKSDLLELFGRLTSKVTSNWEVWSLYAKLLGDGMLDLEESNNDKALHYLQKALRSSIQRIGWEKDEKTATENVDLCLRLIGESCKNGNVKVHNGLNHLAVIWNFHTLQIWSVQCDAIAIFLPATYLSSHTKSDWCVINWIWVSM